MNKNIQTFLIVLGLVIIAGGVYSYFLSFNSAEVAPADEGNKTEPATTEAEARAIAEKTCLKEGESLAADAGMFNENSKTWWFDANLNEAPSGCHPACVVFEETGTAEINWRCTGLIAPVSTIGKMIKELLVGKYPKYAASLEANIEEEDESHARGSVIFEPGAPGGIFLAAKIDGKWKIVYDGNGQIPCSLSKYNFPSSMLSDCAD